MATESNPLNADERRVLDLLGQPVYLIDPRLRVLFLNAKAREVFGRPGDRFLGRPCHAILGKTEAPCPGCPLDRIIHSPVKGLRHAVQLRTGDGRVVTFAFEASPYTSEGKIIGYLVQLREQPFGPAASRQDAGDEALASILNEVSIRDIFDLDFLEQTVSLFAEIHGVTSAIFDDRQEMVTGVYNFSEACKMVRSTEQGLADCLESDIRLLAAASENHPCTLACQYAGLMDAVSPIVIHGRRFGTWALGQVMIEGQADVDRFRAYAERIGIDPGEFLRALDGQTTMPMGRMQKLAEFLQLLTQMLGRIGLQNLALNRLHEHLAREKELLAVTLRSIGEGVITIDQRGRVLLINEAAQRLTGKGQQEAEGMPLAEILPLEQPKYGEGTDNLAALLVKGERVTSCRCLLAAGGRERAVDCTGAPLKDRDGTPLGAVITVQDVTEKVRTAEELAKIAKLESVGVLAGGIAHDFNNLLTAVIGNLSLAKLQTATGDPRLEILAAAQVASLRAKELTQQLLTFARGGSPVKKMTALPDLIRGTAEFVLHGSAVTCSFDFEEHLWPAPVDDAQIGQVFQNLLINAEQAMPKGGAISIRARNLDLAAGTGLPLRPGKYVRIRVRDLGPGIPAENAAKIFDPFYTTKPKGSGLGLAICFSILKNHGGHIGVEPTAGEGACFSIYLPAFPEGRAEMTSLQKTPFFGSGRLLVMDDDPAVQQFVSRALVFLGYAPTLAANGGEALRLYREAAASGQPFAAVLMDLIIPGGKGGEDTIAELLALDPRARVVVMSGYAKNPLMAEYRRFGFADVLPKPFRTQELGQTLRRVLAEPDQESPSPGAEDTAE